MHTATSNVKAVVIVVVVVIDAFGAKLSGQQ